MGPWLAALLVLTALLPASALAPSHCETIQNEKECIAVNSNSSHSYAATCTWCCTKPQCYDSGPDAREDECNRYVSGGIACSETGAYVEFTIFGVMGFVIIIGMGLVTCMHFLTKWEKSQEEASAKEEGLDGDAGPESPRHEGALALDGLNTYDVGAAIDSIGWGKYQLRLMFQTGVVWCADAMEMMLVSFIMPELKKKWGLLASETSLIGVFTFVGILVGNMFWGRLSDRAGRRWGYLFSTSITIVFGILSACAPTTKMIGFPFLLCTRMMVGFGLGGAVVAFSLFSEFIPNSARGTSLIAVQGAFWSAGAAFSSLLAWGIIPTLGWRWFLVASAAPLVILLALFPYLPESPRYLALRGKFDAANLELRKAADANGTALPPGELVEAVLSTDDNRGSFGALLGGFHIAPDDGEPKAPSRPNGRTWGRVVVKDFVMFKTTMLLVPIWMAIVFTYYGIVFVTPRYYTSGDVYAGTFVTTLAELPGLLLAAFLIDRIGRKKSSCLQLSMYAVFAMLLLLGRDDKCKMGLGVISPTAATVLIFLARGAINGAFSCIYVYTPEIFPTSVRVLGIGVCSSAGRFAGMITSVVAEDACVLVASTSFAIAALGAIACAAHLPVETSGRALDAAWEEYEGLEPGSPEHFAVDDGLDQVREDEVYIEALRSASGSRASISGAASPFGRTVHTPRAAARSASPYGGYL